MSSTTATAGTSAAGQAQRPAESSAAPAIPECADSAFPWVWLGRHGRWLVLTWPPLLLSGFLISSLFEKDWSDVAFLAAVAAAFTLAVLARYRARSTQLLSIGLFGTQGLLTAVALMASATGRSDMVYALMPLLAIAAAVVFYARHSPVAIVGVSLAGSGLLVAGGWAVGTAAWLAFTSILSGMGTYGVFRLADTVAELARTRKELANSAVAAERLRFSRDLHDLLGHSLSVIVVKAEAVRRLAEADPAAAAAHGTDIETLGRSALSEVREAVAGYRANGFASELRHAAQSLSAGGIKADVADGGPLTGDCSEQAEAVLSWVVREGTTNVLRHSGARSCRIRVGADAECAWVSVEDDGVGHVFDPTAARTAESPPDDGRYPMVLSGGAGLLGLKERLTSVGGGLSVDSVDGGFALRATVPLDAAPRPEHVVDRGPEPPQSAGRR